MPIDLGNRFFDAQGLNCSISDCLNEIFITFIHAMIDALDERIAEILFSESKENGMPQNRLNLLPILLFPGVFDVLAYFPTVFRFWIGITLNLIYKTPDNNVLIHCVQCILENVDLLIQCPVLNTLSINSAQFKPRKQGTILAQNHFRAWQQRKPWTKLGIT